MTIRLRLLLIVLSTLVPTLFSGFAFLQNRERELGLAQRDLAAASERVAQALSDTVKATTQLHLGLARARDLQAPGPAPCSAFLAEVLRLQPLYNNLVTLTPTGDLHCDGRQSGQPFNLADRTYFRQVMAVPGQVVVEPGIGRQSGRASLQVAYGVPKANTAEVAFVLLATLDLERFMAQQAKVLPRGNTTLLMLDGAGTVLAALPAKPGRTPGSAVAGTVLANFQTQLSQGEGHFTDTTDDPTLWAGSAVTGLPLVGLHVLMGVKQTDLLAAANLLLQQQLFLLVLLCGLTISAAWLLAEHNLSRPIQHVEEVLARFVNGDVDARSGVNLPAGEMGQLMITLDHALDQVQRQQENVSQLNSVLDQRVNESTSQLAKAERLLRDATDGVPGAVYQFEWTRNKPPRLSFISNGIQELTGVDAQAALRDVQAVFAQVVEEDRAVFFDSMSHAVKTDAGFWDHEFRVHHPDGTVHWTRSSARASGSGGDTVWNGYWVDISEHKRTQAVLQSAKDDAEHANAAKSSFLATMSHEIRTPMNGLLGMLELLNLTALDHEQKETLAIARDSGQSLGRIIDDILDHAKIEAGKLEIRPEPVALAQLLPRAVNMYQAPASAKSLVLRQMVDPRLAPVVMVDPLRLLQVLGNLLSNAIKFTTEGYVELRADLVSRQADSDTQTATETVCFSVKDTGIGMSEQAQQRLFQPFEQASADTVRLYGGTGLGLAISRRLVEMMGGSIAVNSVLNEGTTLSVTLPLPIGPASGQEPKGDPDDVPAPALAPAAQATQLTALRAAAPALHNEVSKLPAPGARVLAVDDNPTNRLVLVRQLSALGLGLRIESASDGRDALAQWRPGGFSLVITDCNMPEMDGYALARAIREAEAQEGRDRTAIVGWTANAMPGVLEKCQAAGMDAILTKPADLSQLRNAVLAQLAPQGVQPLSATDASNLRSLFSADWAESGVDSLELVRVVHAQMVAQIEQLEQLLDGCDWAALAQASHTIKGAAGLMGLTALAGVGEQIETAARSEDLTMLGQQRVALARAGASALAVLATMHDTPKPLPPG